MLRFGLHADSTRFAVLLDEFTESRPGIFMSNEINCLVLTRVSGKYVIVFETENAESEIVRVGDIDEIVVSEKTVRSDSPVGFRIVEVGFVERVRWECL